jgi:uncharacterized protein (TIGR00255 family)
LLRSMTGYGNARISGDGFELTIEVKSVNNRFLKISSKLSEEIIILQNDLEEEVRELIDRGSIFLVVIFRATRLTDLFDIDEQVLRKYMERLRKLKTRMGKGQEIGLKDLLLLPGVVRSEDSFVHGKETVLPVAVQGVKKAVRAMIAMREQEGKNLLREFRTRAKLLRDLLSQIEVFAPRVIEDYRERLRERVNRILVGHDVEVPAQDLLKEVAIMAERSDITEEIDRMRSHLDQFAECLDAREPVGRKLEFLVQEMFREANTMASKSISATLSRNLVEMKAEVDRLKEQVQNLE